MTGGPPRSTRAGASGGCGRGGVRAVALACAAVALACATGGGAGPAPGRSGAREDGDEVAAGFARAERLYGEGRLSEAHGLLSAIADRPDLSPEDRVRALADRGVVEAEEGQDDAAERTLAGAIGMPAGDASRPYAAKARFYLGELARTRFEAVALDPRSGDVDELSRQLESKSALLIAAQDRYLAAVAAGDPSWAVAAGTRIGELYERLRTELVEAPLPPGIEGEVSAAYRSELRQRVRVLVSKAIDAYRDTLALARARHVDAALVDRLEQGVGRMEQLLAQP